MNQTKEIFTILAIILIILIVIPMIIGEGLWERAEYLAEKNQCTLKVNSAPINLFTSQEYKCPNNIKLENKLNSYIKQSDFWSFVGLIPGFILFRSIQFFLPIILCAYCLVKLILKCRK